MDFRFYYRATTRPGHSIRVSPDSGKRTNPWCLDSDQLSSQTQSWRFDIRQTQCGDRRKIDDGSGEPKVIDSFDVELAEVFRAAGIEGREIHLKNVFSAME